MPQYQPEVAELVQKHHRLIRWVTFKYRHYFRMERCDAIQSAALGMLYAARSYRPNVGCSFATYALKRMLVTGRRESLRTELPLRVPIRDYWRCVWLDYRVKVFGRESLYQRFVSSKRLRRQTRYCLKTIWRIRRTKSLSNPRSKLAKAMVAPELNLEAKLEKEEQATMLGVALDRLEPWDSELLRLRYGIGCREQTLEELGRTYNLTRERIRQRQVRAEQKLRSILTGEPVARHEHSRKKWLEQISRKLALHPQRNEITGGQPLVSLNSFA